MSRRFDRTPMRLRPATNAAKKPMSASAYTVCRPDTTGRSFRASRVDSDTG